MMWHLRAHLLAIAGLVAMSAVQAQHGNTADRPDVAVGDTWTYKQTFNSAAARFTW
jgi:hypothetical protein